MRLYGSPLASSFDEIGPIGCASNEYPPAVLWPLLSQSES